MEGKVIYVSYKLSGFERDMWCDYCGSPLVRVDFGKVYYKFYQNEEGLWFKKIICPYCYHEDVEVQAESPATETVSFSEANGILQRSIVKTFL